jgi:putative membrane protein
VTAAARRIRARVRPAHAARQSARARFVTARAAAASRPSRALFAALVATQVAYGKVPALRDPAGTRGIVCLMLGASAAEAVEARGARGAAAVVGAGALGFAVELLGVATGRPFGHYHYSDRLGPRVGGVPLLAAAAWAMMARPSWVVAGRLARRRAARIPLAAGALTAWDVFLDPRMAREGFWTWPGGGRYEGIPASNFLGWFVTGLGVFALWEAVDPAEAPDARDDGALALYVWTWVGETFANAALWRRPVTAVAGSAAMGAFAAPALAARLRSGGPARPAGRRGRLSWRR